MDGGGMSEGHVAAANREAHGRPSMCLVKGPIVMPAKEPISKPTQEREVTGRNGVTSTKKSASEWAVVDQLPKGLEDTPGGMSGGMNSTPEPKSDWPDLVVSQLTQGHTGQARAAGVQGHAAILGMIQLCHPHKVVWGGGSLEETV